MGTVGLIVSGTVASLRATEDYNCACCNSDGTNKEGGVIKAGELFAYWNVRSQYVLKGSGEFIIPYRYRARKTFHMDPRKFKKYVKIHIVCPGCSDKLFFFIGLRKPSPFPTGIILSIKTDPIYYTGVSASEKEYIATCCGKTLPRASEYVRFGIFQSGCTCMECFDVFKHLE